jgi:Flp pilus assembly protein TadD
MRREQSEAVYAFQQAMAVAPDDHRPYYLAALALRDGKDYRNAEKLLRQAAELAPNDLNIRRQLGAVIALNLVHHSQEANSCL